MAASEVSSDAVENKCLSQSFGKERAAFYVTALPSVLFSLDKSGCFEISSNYKSGMQVLTFNGMKSTTINSREVSSRGNTV